MLHLKLTMLAILLATKASELADWFKAAQVKRITKRHFKRETARKNITRKEEAIRFKSFIRAQCARNRLSAQSDADDALYTFLKGEA